MARCGGSLKYDEVAQAMRSCYPEYVAPKRRSTHYVEEDVEAWYSGDYDYPETEAVPEEQEPSFRDVEMFLAEHNHADFSEEVEVYPEHEIAEVLAATWKDKRASPRRRTSRDLSVLVRPKSRSGRRSAIGVARRATGPGSANSLGRQRHPVPRPRPLPRPEQAWFRRPSPTSCAVSSWNAGQSRRGATPWWSSCVDDAWLFHRLLSA